MWHMRKTWLGTLVLPAFLAAACESDPSSSTNQPGFDGGAPSFDSGASPFDAGGADAPATKGVTVTVVSGTTPIAGARVVFHDAAGAVTGEQQTDALGKVSVATAPSQVTVIVLDEPPAFSSGGRLVTYTDVADGDTLVVDASEPESEQPVALFEVTLPGVYDGAANYVVRTGNCTAQGAPDEPLALVLTRPCVRTPTSVLAVAEDANGRAVAYAFKKGNTPPASDPNDPKSVPVTVPGPWVPSGSVQLTATNLPPGSSTEVALFTVSEQSAFFSSYPTTILEEGPVEFPVPTGFPDAVQAYAAAHLERGTLAFLRRAPVAPAIPFDFVQALPRITSATVTPTPKRPEVSWTSAAPLTGSDGGFVSVRWSVQLDPDTSARFSWTFVVPSNATSVKAPELPAALASVAPGDELDTEQVAFIESDSLPSFAALKAVPFRHHLRTGSPFEPSVPLAANANVRISGWNVSD